MNTDLGCHPTTEMLKEYAQGSLSTGWSVALSAHLELCQSCRKQYAELELDVANFWSHDSTYQDTQEFPDLLANIVNKPQEDSVESPIPQESPIAEIHMLDHSFTLPQILAKAANEGLIWKKLAGGINQANLDIDTETQCEFIYMSPGSKTPMHKHQGSEITLVLDGSFSDASGAYEPADFVVRSGKDEHQPVSEGGFLCFAVLDRPLTFTQGVARLFNPINRYRFRKTIAQQS
tara:strand:+ start:721 stop:1422 length:702 start_codon:yes stop_codon:yes gene_type:complete